MTLTPAVLYRTRNARSEVRAAPCGGERRALERRTKEALAIATAHLELPAILQDRHVVPAEPRLDLAQVVQVDQEVALHAVPGTALTNPPTP